jgi:xanthine dehydrogenase YagS FAD-binding subunit
MLNMGTVAGELCQRPRCWYYRAGFGLLAERNGSSMVTAGDNRYHAILGNEGPAYFVSPSSLAPALVALGAKVRVLGPDGERELPVAELYRTPVREGERELALGREELVTEIVVPRRGLVSATYEVRPRTVLDWPLAAAAVAFALEGDVVSEATVVLGHVAPVPWTASAAAERLRGQSLSEATAATAAEAAVEGARPLSRNGYKVQLARTATRRAILRASSGDAVGSIPSASRIGRWSGPDTGTS